MTEQNFVDLQLEDYAELGVVDQTDRHKLFRLKQIIKQEMDVVVKSQAAARRLGNGLSNLAAALNGGQQPQPQQQQQASSAAPSGGAGAAAQARERMLAEAVHSEQSAFGNGGRQAAAPPAPRRAPSSIDNIDNIELYGDDDFLAPVAPAPVFGGRRSGGGRAGAAAAVAAGGIGFASQPSAPMQQPSAAPIPSSRAPQHQPQQQQHQQHQQHQPQPSSSSFADQGGDEYDYNDGGDDDEDADSQSFDVGAHGGGGRRVSGGGGGRKSKISVVVRKRPLNTKERKNAEVDIVTVRDEHGHSITVHEPKIKVDLTKFTNNQEFTFDGVFDTEATNVEIYRRTAQPLIEHLFKQGKATCFAYGQTGSGKTFTMMGPGTNASYEHQGLYVQASRDIFALLARPEFAHLNLIVSFFEIYGGKLFDLLNGRQKLVAREDANQQCCVVGLTEKPCSDIKCVGSRRVVFVV